MPRWQHPGQLILILALCLLGSAAFAQDAKPILVGFVEDRLLRTASITDNGIDGVSRLGEIFRHLGATTQLLRLDGPIPEDMDIVVLVRPSRPLSSAQMARLWLHLQHGKHLLLAIDPDYLAGVQPTAATSGLNRLLTLDYGLGMQNGTLLEPWFQLAQFDTALKLSAAAQAENFVQHPIIAPILHYDLPVRTWGAGNLLVDAFGTDSQADALLYTETAYGETDRNSLRGAEDATPLGLNIGVDYQGRLLIGGVAVNTATGSRVALLGDSEIVENLYGLSRIANDSAIPLHPGNRILTERLVAWLMGLPEESWPALPEGLTWIALDGDASDWPTDLPAVEDAILDAPENDLQSIQTFSNDQYVYVLLRAFKLKPDASLEFSAQDGQRLRQILYAQGQFIGIDADGAINMLPDAGIAFGQVVEVRLPRRALGSAETFSRVCIGEPTQAEQDCLEESMPIRATSDRDPVPVRPYSGPMASVLNSANLRLGPSTDTPVQVTLRALTPLAVLGRDGSGDWIRVSDGRWEGWIATPLLQMNIEVDQIPVVPGQQ